MQNKIHAQHWNDSDGNPAGGSTFGNGFAISWQNGPLGRHAPECTVGGTCVEGCTRRPPNGAFVEDIIAAAMDRINFYQGSRFHCGANPADINNIVVRSHSKFKCAENAEALLHLKAALNSLDERTQTREARAVEGTHKE